MGFLVKAAGIFNKIKGNLSQPDQKSNAQSLLSIITKFGKMKLIIAIAPFAIVLTILLVVTISDAKDLEQVQMADPNAGKETATKASGTGIYTDADFQDAVNVSDSSPKFSGFGDVAAALNGSSFKSVSGFNEFIKSSVNKAGFGTREGVVAAAMGLCYELPKATGSKYFYTYPGALTHNGAAKQEGISENTYLDCRAFVQWAVYNGGFNANELEYIGDVASIGTVKTDVRSVQPGDIFSTSGFGHTWLVVGVDANGYYSAEEYGGAEINYYTWDNAFNGYGATLYDMSAYYSNPANVRGH